MRFLQNLGGAENAACENDGQSSKHENAWHENAGLEMLDTKMDGVKQLTCYEVTRC